MFSALAAAALAAAQTSPTPFTSFDETVPGWTIVRRTDGCFAYTGEGGSAFNIYYKTNEAEHSLGLMFTDEAWQLNEGGDGDYQIVYVGTGQRWDDLNGERFPRPAGSRDLSFISISFDQSAIAAMLSDIGAASGVALRQGGQPVFRVGFANGGRAMSRLADCARTLTRAPVPPPAAPR